MIKARSTNTCKASGAANLRRLLVHLGHLAAAWQRRRLARLDRRGGVEINHTDGGQKKLPTLTVPPLKVENLPKPELEIFPPSRLEPGLELASFGIANSDPAP